jgi:hypothetical protein
MARVLKDLNYAATVIQRRFRAVSSLKHWGALKIQTQWRRYMHRNVLRDMKRAKFALEALVHSLARTRDGWCSRRIALTCAAAVYRNAASTRT